jgi:hypothetical protein
MRGRQLRLWLIGIVIFAIGVLGLSPGAQATSRHTSPLLAGEPSRVGSYDNAAVADVALRYASQSAGAGRYGGAACVDAGRSGATGGAPLGNAFNEDGQCKAFVNCVLWMASGHTQWPAPGYSDGFLNAGAVEVNEATAVKGDIIQWDYNSTTGKLHTAIVVENRGGGVFRAVDSNFNNDRKVWDHVYNVHMGGYLAPRFFRMGTPRGGGVADGSFVNYAGNVYIIVGGAPLYVGTWSIYGGEKPSTPLTSAQFAALRPYPADGTLINSQTGSVYRYAGGAPMYVAAWADIGGPQSTILVNEDDVVNSGAAAPFDHSRKVPVDGTFVNTQTGAVYRFVGGAPLYISSWDDVGGSQPSTRVSQLAIDQGGNPNAPWATSRSIPATGRSSTRHPVRCIASPGVHPSTWVRGMTSADRSPVPVSVKRRSTRAGIWRTHTDTSPSTRWTAPSSTSRQVTFSSSRAVLLSTSPTLQRSAAHARPPKSRP